MRLILEIDLEFLKNEFINVYMKGDRILYISPYDKDGKTIDIRDTDTWREHWQLFKKSFEEIFKNDRDYENWYNNLNPHIGPFPIRIL